MGVEFPVDGVGGDYGVSVQVTFPVPGGVVLRHSLQVTHQLKHCRETHDHLVAVNGQHGETRPVEQVAKVLQMTQLSSLSHFHSVC